MAHFAKLDSNNNVISVHVVVHDVMLDNGVEKEQLGIDFLTKLHGYSNWKQTSFNRTTRKNYASPGYTYDSSRDAFIPPKPYSSWTLNESTCRWEAPVTYPDDGKFYKWNEDNEEWVEN